MVELAILKKSDGGCLLDFSDEDSYLNMNEEETKLLLDCLYRVRRILTPYPTTTGFVTMDEETDQFQVGFEMGRMDDNSGVVAIVTAMIDGKLSLKIMTWSMEQVNANIHALVN